MAFCFALSLLLTVLGLINACSPWWPRISPLFSLPAPVSHVHAAPLGHSNRFFCGACQSLSKCLVGVVVHWLHGMVQHGLWFAALVWHSIVLLSCMARVCGAAYSWFNACISDKDTLIIVFSNHEGF